MILYIIDNVVLWTYWDITIKEQQKFINDENCIVIDKTLEVPPKPEDDKIWVLKYNNEKSELYYEAIGIKEPTHEEYTKQTYDQATANAKDNLINMELSSDTNEKVNLTSSDSLLLMEMLLTIDEKLNQLLGLKA